MFGRILYYWRQKVNTSSNEAPNTKNSLIWISIFATWFERQVQGLAHGAEREALWSPMLIQTEEERLRNKRNGRNKRKYIKYIGFSFISSISFIS